MLDNTLTLQSEIISYFTSSPKYPNKHHLHLWPETNSVSFEKPKPRKKPKYIMDFSDVLD